MKRIWFAGIFLTLAVIMCVAEQVYINSLYNNLNTKISAAQAAINDGNFDEYIAKTKDIADYWDKKNDILYSVTEHSQLDSLALQMRTLPYGRDEAQSELKKLKALLFAFYEDERISFANIS